MSALPGPPSLPIVGNLTQMMGYKQPQTHIVWTKWARQYGKLYRCSSLCGATIAFLINQQCISHRWIPAMLSREELRRSL